MKMKMHEAVSDICFLGVLVLVFAGMVFLAMDHNYFAFNVVVLCIAVLMFMFVYFGSLKTGMILNMAFFFLFLAFSVAGALKTGARVGANIYFWLIWPLLMSAVITGFTWKKKCIEKENNSLREKVEKFVTIDEVTQMNNLLAFERDARVYMNLSKRYRLPLVLVLWRLRQQADLERLLNKGEMQKALSRISDAVRGSLRGEDLVYLVDRESYTWAVLLFTDPGATGIVQNRVADRIRKAGEEFYSGREGISLELYCTAVSYDGAAKTPLGFLAQAKEELTVSPQIEKRVASADKERKSRRPSAAEQVPAEAPQTNRGRERVTENEDGYDFEVSEDDDWDI